MKTLQKLAVSVIDKLCDLELKYFTSKQLKEYNRYIKGKNKPKKQTSYGTYGFLTKKLLDLKIKYFNF